MDFIQKSQCFCMRTVRFSFTCWMRRRGSLLLSKLFSKVVYCRIAQGIHEQYWFFLFFYFSSGHPWERMWPLRHPSWASGGSYPLPIHTTFDTSCIYLLSSQNTVFEHCRWQLCAVVPCSYSLLLDSESTQIVPEGIFSIELIHLQL